MRSKTQPASPFKGGEPAVHHERAVRALERLGTLCYDVAKPMKECGCQETVFTNSLVGTKTGGRSMATSYNKLWKLLVDKKMSKADLRKASGVSPNTMTKLRRDEPVMLSVLDKICKVLDVNYGDVVDYIADEEGSEKS